MARGPARPAARDRPGRRHPADPRHPRRASAGSFDLGSQLRFAESSDFDVSDLTLDAWILPASRPAGGKHSWILDNNTEYFATYEDNGTVRCGIAGNTVDQQDHACRPRAGTTSPAPTTANDQELRVYIDGDLSGCANASPIPQGGRDGIAIGANYGAGGVKDELPRPARHAAPLRQRAAGQRYLQRRRAQRRLRRPVHD